MEVSSSNLSRDAGHHYNQCAVLLSETLDACLLTYCLWRIIGTVDTLSLNDFGASLKYYILLRGQTFRCLGNFFRKYHIKMAGFGNGFNWRRCGIPVLCCQLDITVACCAVASAEFQSPKEDKLRDFVARRSCGVRRYSGPPVKYSDVVRNYLPEF